MDQAVEAAPGDRGAEIHSALATIWPDDLRTLLLTASLRTGDDAEDAWRRFVATTGDPKPFFEHDKTGLKGLLPMVHAGARRNGFDLERRLWTYLRSAAVREELRYRVYATLCGNLLKAVSEAGIPVVALKACGLAGTVYDAPAERHCHAIDVLVPADALSRIGPVIRRFGFMPANVPEARPGARQGFRHESGLPLVAHANLFDRPVYLADAERLWAESRPATIAEAPVRVLSPAHNLVHVLGHAFHDRARKDLRWVCDAWLLIHGEERPDWDEFVRFVQAGRLGLPVLTMLRYLVERLGADVPPAVLDECAASIDLSDRPRRDAALSAALVGRAAIREIWSQRMRSADSRKAMLQYLLTPSSPYVRWRFGAASAVQVPLLYLYRPISHVVQRLWWRILGLPGFGRFTRRGRVAAEMEKLRA